MASDPSDKKRKYLVVIDDTEECDRAVTFAAHRIRHSSGSVILMAVIGGAMLNGVIRTLSGLMGSVNGLL